VSVSNTEKVHASGVGLSSRSPQEVADLLVRSQVEASRAVCDSVSQICLGAARMAAALRGGGRLWYVAAGSSGLLAAADAMELGGTFGIPASQIRILMAGGIPRDAEMPGGTEDEIATLSEGLASISAQDCLIAVSASGTTPYTLEAARLAQEVACPVIGLANNPGAALLRMADVPVLLQTPPEVLSGSTRLGAGTAQKIALNTLSTLMALELGHIHDGLMVNMRVDNAKLRARAISIVTQISKVAPDTAERAVKQANGDIKTAILLAAGLPDIGSAKEELQHSGGRLGPILERLSA